MFLIQPILFFNLIYWLSLRIFFTQPIHFLKGFAFTISSTVEATKDFWRPRQSENLLLPAHRGDLKITVANMVGAK